MTLDKFLQPVVLTVKLVVHKHEFVRMGEVIGHGRNITSDSFFRGDWGQESAPYGKP